MRRPHVLLALSVLLLPVAGRAEDALDTPSEQRVIFHTLAGDMVFVLYPKAAPKTVEQFLKLVQAGVYDTTAFVRVEPGFVMQVSDASNDRTVPLTREQKALIHPLPDEFNALKHVRGVLSMAHWDRPNSGETSFSILLSAAPHLDSKYTVFGRVQSGFEVLNEMLKVPRDGNRPIVRLQVQSATVLPTPQALAAVQLAAARPIPFTAPAPTTAVMQTTQPAQGLTEASSMTPILGGIALIILVGLASFFLQGKVPPAVHSSLNLVMVLIAMFLLMLVGLPLAHRRWPVAMGLFFGLIGILKVLGKFETAVDVKK